MNLVAISGSGWSDSAAAGQALLARIAQAGGDDTILLDRDTIRREASMIERSSDTAAQAGTHQCIVPFDTWMKDSRVADDCINSVAIQETARTIAPQYTVVIDARNYSLQLIADALRQARIAWYPIDQWHPTFALVCDDAMLLRVLQLLAPTFYSQPQVLTSREVKVIVRRVMSRAKVYRYFGGRARHVLRWIEKSTRRVRAARDRFSFLAGERKIKQ
jgi:hypothetical protein